MKRLSKAKLKKRYTNQIKKLERKNRKTKRMIKRGLPSSLGKFNMSYRKKQISSLKLKLKKLKK